MRIDPRLTSFFPSSAAHFDRDASRYHAGTYKRKRAELVTAVDIALSPLFLGHIKNVHKAVVRDFKRELLEGLQGRDYDFGALVETGRAKAEKTFTDAAEGASRMLLESNAS